MYRFPVGLLVIIGSKRLCVKENWVRESSRQALIWSSFCHSSPHTHSYYHKLANNVNGYTLFTKKKLWLWRRGRGNFNGGGVRDEMVEICGRRAGFLRSLLTLTHGESWEKSRGTLFVKSDRPLCRQKVWITVKMRLWFGPFNSGFPWGTVYRQ